MKTIFELRRSTVLPEYQQALNWAETMVVYQSYKEAAYHFGLSVNTLRKAINNEPISSKTLSKIRMKFVEDTESSGE